MGKAASWAASAIKARSFSAIAPSAFKLTSPSGPALVGPSPSGPLKVLERDPGLLRLLLQGVSGIQQMRGLQAPGVHVLSLGGYSLRSPLAHFSSRMFCRKSFLMARSFVSPHWKAATSETDGIPLLAVSCIVCAGTAWLTYCLSC